MIKTIKRILKEQYLLFPYEKFFTESKDDTLKKIIDKFGKPFVQLLFNKLDKMYDTSVIWDDSIKPYDITIINKMTEEEVSLQKPSTYILNLIGDRKNGGDIDDAIDIITSWINTK